ncbi:MAG: EutN/CcmL family microcompartment protein [Planctomycetota bacterium]
MRIGKVIGKLSLVSAHPSLVGKRWLLAVPFDLDSLVKDEQSKAEELVVIDELGARAGDRIGISEGMEAVFPYLPKKVPVDAYNACILDEVRLDQRTVESIASGNA